jgi:hypothetical protein
MTGWDRLAKPLLWGGAIAGGLATLAAALVFGELNQDEGWYLYAAGQLAEGRLPYRDFAFTQGPVMVLIYALASPLVEAFGVAGGRLATLVFGLGACACAAMLAARLVPDRRREAALAVILLVGLNAYQAYFFTAVKTYALTALFVGAGLLGLLGAGVRGRTGAAILAGICFALATATRLSAGFVLPAAAVYLAAEHGRIGWRPAAAFVLASAGALAAIVLPFAVAAPDGVWFGLVEYHGSRKVGPAGLWLMYKGGAIARLCQAYFVAVAAAVCLAGWRIARPAGAGLSGGLTPEGRFAAAAAAALGLVALVHLSAPFPYDDYQTFLFPAAAALLAAVALRSLPAGVSTQPLLGVLLLIGIVSVGASPVVQNWFVRGQDRIWWRMRREPPLCVLRKAASDVRRLAGEGRTLLTQDLYLAVEARMEVPRGMELGPFSYYPDWPRDRSDRRNVLNRDALAATIASCDAAVAAVSGYGLAIRSPDLTPVPDAERAELLDAILARYEPAGEVADFGQAGTRLQLYRRRAAASSGPAQ